MAVSEIFIILTLESESCDWLLCKFNKRQQRMSKQTERTKLSFTQTPFIMASPCLRRSLHLTFSMPTAFPVRRAMMSALRSSPGHDHNPTLSEPPTPAVHPLSSLSHDAAAPQTAARPPPVPKVEKPRPKLKSTKAALSMVCNLLVCWRTAVHQHSESCRLRQLLLGCKISSKDQPRSLFG